MCFHFPEKKMDFGYKMYKKYIFVVFSLVFERHLKKVSFSKNFQIQSNFNGSNTDGSFTTAV